MPNPSQFGKSQRRLLRITDRYPFQWCMKELSYSKRNVRTEMRVPWCPPGTRSQTTAMQHTWRRRRVPADCPLAAAFSFNRVNKSSEDPTRPTQLIWTPFWRLDGRGSTPGAENGPVFLENLEGRAAAFPCAYRARPARTFRRPLQLLLSAAKSPPSPTPRTGLLLQNRFESPRVCLFDRREVFVQREHVGRLRRFDGVVQVPGVVGPSGTGLPP